MQKAENLPLGLLRRVLCGAVLAALLALLLSMLCAGLIISEILPIEAAGLITLLTALIAVFVAALVTIRVAGQRSLIVALGVGAVYLLLALLLRLLCFDGDWSAAPVIGTVVGSAAAGLLGARRKKRRK